MAGLFEEEYDEYDEEHFYNENYLGGYLEDDEISSEEEGFMIGYLR